MDLSKVKAVDRKKICRRNSEHDCHQNWSDEMSWGDSFGNWKTDQMWFTTRLEIENGWPLNSKPFRAKRKGMKRENASISRTSKMSALSCDPDW